MYISCLRQTSQKFILLPIKYLAVCIIKTIQQFIRPRNRYMRETFYEGFLFVNPTSSLDLRELPTIERVGRSARLVPLMNDFPRRYSSAVSRFNMHRQPTSPSTHSFNRLVGNFCKLVSFCQQSC